MSPLRVRGAPGRAGAPTSEPPGSCRDGGLPGGGLCHATPFCQFAVSAMKLAMLGAGGFFLLGDPVIRGWAVCIPWMWRWRREVGGAEDGDTGKKPLEGKASDSQTLRGDLDLLGGGVEEIRPRS